MAVITEVVDVSAVARGVGGAEDGSASLPTQAPVLLLSPAYPSRRPVVVPASEMVQ